MRIGSLAFALGVGAVLSQQVAGATPLRGLTADDFDRLQTVESPVCSADGQWIAYTVTTIDREADERHSAVWIVNWAGSEHWRLTEPRDDASSPQFSPDGRYVSYLASKGANEPVQLFLLNRRGGAARPITDVSGELSDYRWSPDGAHVALVIAGGAAASRPVPRAELGHATVPKPIVIDTMHFKSDRTGYLTDSNRTHLYVLDVATQKLTLLDVADGDRVAHPAWSPDGNQLAYTRTRDANIAAPGVEELYVTDARARATPRRLASYFAADHQSLQWTKDGRRLAYLIGLEPPLSAYGSDRLAVIDAAGGAPVVVTEALDRAVAAPVLTGAPDVLGVLVDDDRSRYPALVHVSTARIERSLSGSVSVTEQCAAAGHVAVLASTDTSAPEIHALEKGHLRALTEHNAPLLAEIKLGAVEDIAYTSPDGTEVHGLLVKPVGYVSGRTYPTILWIHGGPNGQDDHGLAFDTYPLQLERQWFAAHGYAVLAINYRGSSGRGAKFQRAIAADWGHFEVVDLLAGADYAVKSGIADPNRLGIGGWSYGGILTDYTIATDARFKAAISGAGSANQLTMFGTDQYVIQYLEELGAPWAATDLWLRVSYPFFHADRIKTPTLFLGGEKDFNVPIGGGEQMYQALRTLGVPTTLVVYPGQFHLFTRPSYVHDRIERYLAWYDRYLKSPGDGARP